MYPVDPGREDGMDFLIDLLENPQIMALLLGAAGSFVYGQIKARAAQLQKAGPWVERAVLTVVTVAIVQGLQLAGISVTESGDVSAWGEAAIQGIMAALYGHALHHLKGKVSAEPAPAEVPKPEPPADAA